MKRLSIAAVCVLGLGGLLCAEGATLFTHPVIVVSPPAVDFGAVAVKKTATNTFLVENAGGGKLVGKATVAAPFRILSGGSYSLSRKETQVVVVTYTPAGSTTDVRVVKFTGASGAKATVTGKPIGGAK